MTELLPNIFAIQVPVDSYEHFINRDIIYWDSESNSYDFVELPPGSYSFICASLTATEEEAAKIVEKGRVVEREFYMSYVTGRPFYYYASMSLKSLLRSKGLNPELNYAILRKQF